MKKIFYVAGKSGGHIVPALTHAEQFLQSHPEHEIGMFTTDAPLDRQLLAATKVVRQHIPLVLGTIKRSSLLDYPRAVAGLIRAWWRSLKVLHRNAPEKVISMGGYVSIPVCLAAWVLRIPFEIYELNVVPGAAAKFLAPFATRIFVCFEKTKTFFSKKKTSFAAYPVRFSDADRVDATTARQKLGLDPHKKTIFVIGGSQGSHLLNTLIQTFIEQAGRHDLQMLHQTGAQAIDEVRAWYEQHNIAALVFPYRDDIQWCYAAADLVITRAGAGALHELIFFGKPAIIIPLEVATTGHQVDNAQAVVALDHHRWRMLRQAEFANEPRLFYEAVDRFLAKD